LNSDSWQKIRKTAANAYLGHMLKSFEFYIPKEAVHAWLVAMIMGHRSIANTVIYTAVADKRIRNIWGK
jgi:site-specific recombinase XerD